jgi:hypothetical protein
MPDIDPDNIPVLNDIIDDDEAQSGSELQVAPALPNQDENSHNITADRFTDSSIPDIALAQPADRIEIDDDNSPNSVLIGHSDIDEQDEVEDIHSAESPGKEIDNEHGHDHDLDHKNNLAALNQPYRAVSSPDELTGRDEMAIDDTPAGEREPENINHPDVSTEIHSADAMSTEAASHHDDIPAALNEPYRPFDSTDEVVPGEASPDDLESIEQSKPEITADNASLDAMNQQALHEASDGSSLEASDTDDTTIGDANDLDQSIDIEALTERVTRKIMPQLELQLKLIVRHALMDSLKGDDK